MTPAQRRKKRAKKIVLRWFLLSENPFISLSTYGVRLTPS
jgi:hypothetical protein